VPSSGFNRVKYTIATASTSTSTSTKINLVHASEKEHGGI
jgi:hypothetical protein